MVVKCFAWLFCQVLHGCQVSARCLCLCVCAALVEYMKVEPRFCFPFADVTGRMTSRADVIDPRDVARRTLGMH